MYIPIPCPKHILLRGRGELARRAGHSMQPLARKVGSAKVLAQAAIAGALNAERLDVRENAVQAAGYIATRLDLLELPEERGWQGEAREDGGLSFSRRMRGLTERYLIDGVTIRSAEAHRPDAMAAELQAPYAHHSTLIFKI